MLNSERIGERFGCSGIEILSEKDGLRKANLYSVEGDEQVCRTYALVRTLDAAPEIVAEHAAIGSGQSIGATFRDGGWKVAKHTMLIGTLEPSDVSPDVAMLMQLSTTDSIAIHVYELQVERQSCHIRYATIVELHHPDHLQEEDLRALSPTPAQKPGNRRQLGGFLERFERSL